MPRILSNVLFGQELSIEHLKEVQLVGPFTPTEGDVLQLTSVVGPGDYEVTPRTLVGLKADLALNNVNNTTDAGKPVSTATQTALDAKLDIPAGANDDLLQRKSGAWVPRTLAQVRTDLAIGYLPYALPLGLAASDVVNAAGTNLAANGGTILIPVALPAPLVLESISLYNTNTTLARSWEWRLYREPAAGGATLDEVAGANGSESFTAAAVSVRLVAATSVATLAPGLYWLAARSSHATNAFTLGGFTLPAGNATMAQNSSQTKTITALTGTLDAVTGWSKAASFFPGLRLNGRVFAQGARW